MAEQPPECLRVALHALGGGDDEHGEIEGRKHALHLGGKIGVAGGVEKIVHRIPPPEIRLTGKDGNAPLALDRFRVQKGVAVIHTPPFAQRTAQVQKLLGERRLARVDVGENADGLSHGRPCPLRKPLRRNARPASSPSR